MSEDTERVSVRTYVPAYQRKRWKDAAEGLGMSLSEFVRTMVQAGRRDFTVAENSREPDPPAVTPGVNDVRMGVLDALDRHGPLEWGELVDELSSDLEDRLEEVLGELDDQGRIRHRPRHGDYVLNGEGP